MTGLASSATWAVGLQTHKDTPWAIWSIAGDAHRGCIADQRAVRRVCVRIRDLSAPFGGGHNTGHFAREQVLTAGAGSSQANHVVYRYCTACSKRQVRVPLIFVAIRLCIQATPRMLKRCYCRHVCTVPFAIRARLRAWTLIVIGKSKEKKAVVRYLYRISFCCAEALMR